MVPPLNWLHQHFNSGSVPARYLALRWGGRRYQMKGVLSSSERAVDKSIKEGGGQLEYEDEDPQVHAYFESELARNGAECHMGDLSPYCTAKSGRTAGAA